ncbi:PucR family transcriptional regulator [Mycolicibacterium tokaiense]|uniref:Purine catabolism PurC domain-containing protein n=1 Tax=Mycolicibacterium tokaiense TaxID=39695 RepID=A0A378TLV6_9MYCO|nr:helix-turn-helix domain-containing protein [Mycolicibacterium tokaiense]STZ61544.1 purine catabolism PurC domain-containing protein [Mycolicibacterium tokaiense]
MAWDLGSIAAVVSGELRLGAGLVASTPVDAVVRLDEFVVVGHRFYATLVVAHVDALEAALRAGDDRAAALSGAVLLAAGGQGDLSALTVDKELCVIAASEPEPELLYARLVALLASDRAAEDRLVTTGTKVLTQVARRGGAEAVVAELAHRIDGWAVLLDAHGQVITTAAAGGLHVKDAVAVAFNRPVRVRHPGLQVHPVGSGEDLSAYLVVSSRDHSTSYSRDLASQAAALLDLKLRSHDHSVTERLGRETMVATLLTGGPAASALLRRWGVHESTLTGFVLTSRSKSVDLERIVLRWFDEIGAVHVLAEDRGRIMGFIKTDKADELVARAESFLDEARIALRLGLGSPAPTDGLARTAAEARQAHEIAVADARTAVRYQAMPTVSYVLDRLDGVDGNRLAAVLDPLRDDSTGTHGELTRTLKIFLAEHGAWGTTASRLKVHRQTLANRIRRIEELTALSMSNPDDRAAAWLALRALER